MREISLLTINIVVSESVLFYDRSKNDILDPEIFFIFVR